MMQRLQQYQINVNLDSQNKKNAAQIQSLNSASSADKRRIAELENDLYDLQGKYSKSKNDLECAQATIDILYQRIRQIKQPEVNEYYTLLDTIKNINQQKYARMLQDCDPRRFIYAIDYIDDALAEAKRYLSI